MDGQVVSGGAAPRGRGKRKRKLNRQPSKTCFTKGAEGSFPRDEYRTEEDAKAAVAFFEGKGMKYVHYRCTDCSSFHLKTQCGCENRKTGKYKRAYLDEAAAEQDMLRVQGQGGMEMRAYLCKRDNVYHLTSQVDAIIDNIDMAELAQEVAKWSAAVIIGASLLKWNPKVAAISTAIAGAYWLAGKFLGKDEDDKNK